MKKRILTLLATICMILLSSFAAFAYMGEWASDEVGTWYKYKDGTYPSSCWLVKDNKLYYMQENGYFAKNTNVFGKFYADDNGVVKNYNFKDMFPSSGWKQDSNGWLYMNEDGTYAKNSNIIVDGKTYWMGTDGYMLHDCYCRSRAYCGSDGAYTGDVNIKDGQYEIVQPKQGLATEKVVVDKYQGAAYGIDGLLEEALNPNSLYIKKIYYSNSNGSQGWYLVCSAQNKSGGYSMCYNTLSAKSDGSMTKYVSSGAMHTSESLMKNNYELLDIDTCIATYNALFNQNRNIDH